MSAALAVYLDRLDPPPLEDLSAAAPSRADLNVSFWAETRTAGLPWRVVALIATHTLETLLLLASWASIGSGALSGRLDYGWLAAWALALATTVPLHAASTWLQGVIAVGCAGLLKQRLLAGAMAMDSDLVHAKGAGQLLSDVLESGAIDQLGASGGIATVLALLELLIVPPLLFWGAGFALEAAILVGWVVLSMLLIGHNMRVRLAWSKQRLALTNQLVEKMTAHRTRLAQQAPAEWHSGEDADTERYLLASRRLDGGGARIAAAVPRGYVITGFAALAPSFVAGSATLVQLAISFGTILFAAAAFERLSFGFSRTAAAWIAWRIVKPTFDAAGRPPLIGVLADVTTPTIAVLQARDVTFTHPGRREPVLSGCSLSVEHGDQILLEGSSGSGKSTFASILSGSRAATGGFVLAGGLDRHTLGDAAWRRRIALAPQYHENHILAAPLIFNLLMARDYPHNAQDIEDAAAVCRDLGLADLLERMPAGLNQFVGDTGWRLSHGERTRIFLARALLQRADVVLLDESLAALDPENLRQCLECIMRRAPTLIVIAHP
ncbi:MAG: ATP-binding cassette domain-containing protein [Steroidobacteraceae bacterium]